MDGGVCVAAGVAAVVGRGVNWSRETVTELAARGTTAILPLVQTAARDASGAMAAETAELLVIVPRVCVPLAMVQLPSEAAHVEVPPLIS